jgi:exopolyphosphatase/pppGpp-phosphohydrolase
MLRYAAVDIGSNSTRMIAAEVPPGEQPRVLLSERVVTRLSESVVRDGRIMDEVERVAAAVAAAILSD